MQTLIVVLIVAWAGYVVFRRFFGRKSCGCGSGSCGSKTAGSNGLRDLNAGGDASRCGCGGCDRPQ